ncbi:MAG: MFS transporter [Nocardioides sp.]|uniref:MFS transporter n=1 Tax=Nocardioides sp. TaxID=35761 RepID=UPI0039E728CA
MPVDPVSAVRRNLIYAALMGLCFVATAGVASLSPLLPTIGTIYGLSVVQASWIFTTLLIAGGVATAFLPRLADVVGDKWAATLVPAAITIGCALMRLSHTYAVVLAGAALLGVAASASPVAMAAMRRAVGSIGRAVSGAQAMTFGGSAIGGVLGAWIVGQISLRGYFVIIAVITLVVTVLVFVAMPTGTLQERGHLGALSLLGGTIWLLAILIGISKGTDWGWTNGRTLGCITGGVVLAFVWYLRERRLPTPVVDFSLFSEGMFTRTVLAGLALGIPSAALSILIPYITQMSPSVAPYGLGKSALDTAWILAPFSACGFFGTLVAGRATSRGWSLRIAACGAVAHCCAAVWLAFMHDHVWSLIVGVIIYGIGIGLVTGGLYGTIQRTVRPERAGMASGSLGLAVCVSGAVGPVIFSTILSHKSVPGAPGVPDGHMFTVSFLVGALCEFIVLLICLSGIGNEARRGAAPRAEAAVSVG